MSKEKNSQGQEPILTADVTSAVEAVLVKKFEHKIAFVLIAHVGPHLAIATNVVDEDAIQFIRHAHRMTTAS